MVADLWALIRETILLFALQFPFVLFGIRSARQDDCVHLQRRLTNKYFNGTS